MYTNKGGTYATLQSDTTIVIGQNTCRVALMLARPSVGDYVASLNFYPALHGLPQGDTLLLKYARRPYKQGSAKDDLAAGDVKTIQAIASTSTTLQLDEKK